MEDFKLARALLQDLGADNEDYPADSADGTAHDNTTTLRIVSIFVILSSGLLGGLPPLFLKVFRDPDSTTTRLVRSFAAGVIAALALVHIIPEAVEEMADLDGIEYPLGGTCALGGIALMVLLEHIAHIMNGDGPHSHGPPGGGGGAAAAAVGGAAAPAGKRRAGGSTRAISPSQSQSLCSVAVEAPPRGAAPAAGPVAEGLLTQQSGSCGDLQAAESGFGAAAGGNSSSAVHSHSHVCVSRGPASNWLTAGAMEAMGSLRLKVVAYLFELGCIFHSFIIGLSLGVNQTDLREVRSLLIALAFHQWLEGISLASVVIRGGFSLVKGGLMILTYSLTCPVGIAVGMAIAETYDAESIKSRAIQGAFNGVSGGMLLYISLVQLVAEDMGRLVPGRDSALGRMTCFAALCGGAASMCLLAVWA